ncbi:MAG TPA: tetratricopeptide repeat protein, partial [Pirellulaceae bacterium]
NPVTSTLSATLACVLVGAWLSTLFLWRSAAASSDRARDHLAASERNLKLAVQAVDQFCSKVSDDERLKVHDLRPLRTDLLKTAVEFHQRLLSLRGKTTGARLDLARAFRRLAELTAQIDDHDRAIELHQRAIREFDALLRDRPGDVDLQNELTLSFTDLGHLFVNSGRAKEAEEVLDRGIAIQSSMLNEQEVSPVARERLASLVCSRGWAMTMTRRFDEAETMWREAISHYERLVADHPDEVKFVTLLAESHKFLGNNLLQESLGNWPDAEVEYETALAIQKGAVILAGAGMNEHQVLSAIHRGLGRIAKVSGRNEEALAHLRLAIETQDEIIRQHPSALEAYAEAAYSQTELAACHALANRLEDEKQALRKAEEHWSRIVRQAPGNTTWEAQFAKVVFRLGRIAVKQGDDETALESYGRGIDLGEAILLREPDSQGVRDIHPFLLIGRGRILARLGKHPEALADAQRAVELAKDDQRESCRLELAMIRALGGDYQSAITDARESLVELEAHCDPKVLGTSY